MGRCAQNERRVGLALGGGGARGIAHVGVLEVLSRAGFRPDLVAGVSAGAIVGAGYCAGLPTESMAELAGQIGWHRVIRPTFPTLSLFDTTPLEDLVVGQTGCRSFADLQIPLAVVACDILSGVEVVLDEGDLPSAVRASAAFPGLFTPIERGEQLLVDGGVVNNLPVSVLRHRGCDYVVAVDLVPPPAEMPRPANLMDMWQMAVFLMVRGTQPSPAEIDCLITPAVGGFSFADFSRWQELLDLGRRAAEDVLEKLREDLALPAQSR